ncbi:two-component system sensor histidine kinase NtrB [Domibacillus aminovorans]|uniref:two-component system sensor histidine kinase NtrB n=1 Tax=Domibacillus aminovorans TaxID=29332 RepID=UPI0007C6656C|nr:ATP-binding protein [Domibacillus aminovorans]
MYLLSEVGGTNINFRQLIDYSFNSILIVEQEGKIIYCNKAFVELLDFFSSNEVIQKNLFAFVSPEFHVLCKQQLKNVIEKQEIAGRGEKKMIRRDGALIDVELMVVPFNMEGKVLAQLIIQDISSRKAAEKRLTDQEQLASIGQIAAGIAHEVKNPLTAVKGFLQLYQEDHSHPYLTTMNAELDKALDTLKNLLQVSKPDLQDEPFVQINICKEIQSILFLFQDRLYSVEVEIDLKDSEKTIKGKKNLFIKAFYNLMTNALDAIEGEGNIKIEHYYKDGCNHIIISDTGIGIPEEKIHILGTPFFTSKSEGTGLGLTQVFTTVQEHGGNIAVQSVLGEGTTFHIQIPIT